MMTLACKSPGFLPTPKLVARLVASPQKDGSIGRKPLHSKDERIS
jgi:hypothetical protein